ncbi:hypothetical protein MGMO_188c00020 [Methyloglobulus morosus KoM1]|uniref:Uncharacterized protein n=1 Tax=Methyloglobulus morosus KoM1 TaxID=1116472 RepID=V5BPH0_9GAMM|nr:hypothetical protein [Methyloglobulus morosus]ESS66473.1 hypothetical protein MGMO_188c00020 [Methyloglobulus morosus KoM1]
MPAGLGIAADSPGLAKYHPPGHHGVLEEIGLSWLAVYGYKMLVVAIEPGLIELPVQPTKGDPDSIFKPVKGKGSIDDRCQIISFLKVDRQPIIYQVCLFRFDKSQRYRTFNAIAAHNN